MLTNTILTTNDGFELQHDLLGRRQPSCDVMIDVPFSKDYEIRHAHTWHLEDCRTVLPYGMVHMHSTMILLSNKY